MKGSLSSCRQLLLSKLPKSRYFALSLESGLVSSSGISVKVELKGQQKVLELWVLLSVSLGREIP